MYRGKKETHSTHAWMLGRLAGDFDFFQGYVVAACCRKMIGRMDNRLSEPYLKAIKNLPKFQFKETDLTPEKKELEMEQTFGNALIALFDAHAIEAPVTNLRALIEKGFSELYAEDTCHEFHQLLCELLNHFQRTLKSFIELENPDRNVFDNAVWNVCCYGEVLQMMAGGVAIQRHFQVIEEELSLSHFELKCDITKQTRNFEVNEEDGVEVNEEDDVELQNLQPFAVRDGKALTMSKAAKGWLKLMVVHFDAIKIVYSHYKNTEMSQLIVKILRPPKLDDKMLPWEELLRDVKYIEARKFDPFNPLFMTSESIIDFLKEHVGKLAHEKGSYSIVEMQKTVDHLIQSSSSNSDSEVAFLKNLETQLLGLRKGMSPDQNVLTCLIFKEIEIFKKLDHGYDVPSMHWHARFDSLYRILSLLDSLSLSSKFFTKLRGPLLNGTGFEGAPHCEILLASSILLAKTSLSKWPEAVLPELLVSLSHHFIFFLYPSDTSQNAGHVLGISKPSCPVCLQVLTSTKMSRSSEPFVFRGSHSAISACTLPTWLPIDVIDDTAKIFGAQLREDLVKLAGRQNIQKQGRPKTSQSDTLSMDSNDGSTKEQYGDRKQFYSGITFRPSDRR